MQRGLGGGEEGEQGLHASGCPREEEKEGSTNESAGEPLLLLPWPFWTANGGMSGRLPAFLASCGGFLLSILTVDLKHDTLLLTRPDAKVAVAMMKAFYTTLFGPDAIKPVFVPIVIAVALVGSVYKALSRRQRVNKWQLGLMAFCGAVPLLRTFPAARRLVAGVCLRVVCVSVTEREER